MIEKYYSIIHPGREYIVEEKNKYLLKISGETLYIFTTFDDELYPVIKKCCVRYEPKEYFFILGWLRKFCYSIYYTILDIKKRKRQQKTKPFTILQISGKAFSLIGPL